MSFIIKINRFSLLLFLLIIIPGNKLFSSNKINMLIIHSYHKELDWTENIQSGIINTLKHKLKYRYNDINFYVEYMDTKRYYDGLEGTYVTKLKDIYKNKFKNIKFDVIISSDDNAFNFLLLYQKTIFKNSPLVFCGVNYFKESMLKNNENVTGVVEVVDLKSTIDLALQLHPKAKNIYIISDNTTTGINNRKLLDNIINNYKYEVNFEYLDKGNGLSHDELMFKLKYLLEDNIILFLDFFRDKNNIFYNHQEIISEITRITNCPIYSHVDMYLGHGIVGGMLNSGYHQGELAGDIAAQILEGKNIKDIPVKKQNVNMFMFDYNQIEKFNIKESLMPEGSIIINRPFSFYNKYKNLVIGTIITITFLLILITFLLINIIRRKRIELILKSIFEGIPDGLLIHSLDGSILHSNKTMYERYGYTYQEFTNMNVSDIETPDVAKEFNNRLHHQLKDKYYTCQLTHHTKSDAIIPVECNTTLIKYHGKPAVVAIVRDITERQNAEEERELLLNELSLKNDELESILYAASHDLRSPLVNIQGFSNELIYNCKELNKLTENLKNDNYINIKKIINKNIPEALNYITASSEKMNKLIKGLLRLSRVGQNGLEIKRINMNKLIDEIINSMQYKIQEMEANIEVGKLPNCTGDYELLTQVFTNLIDNSLKFRKPGKKIIIKIAGKNKKKDLIYSISDNGIGIEKSHSKKIFEIFHRLNPDNNVQGEGLGLTISKRILEHHKGKIWVESNKDSGCTFNILLQKNK